MSLQLEGKRAFVTGGGSGIGRAAALRLADAGARVAILDINLEGAEAAAHEIAAKGGTAIAIRTDVRFEEQVAAAVAQTVQAFGGLDNVIANAGVMLMAADKPAADLDLETWQTSLDINLTGMFLSCKHGLKALLANGGGSIVITSSPTGQLGCAPSFTAYFGEQVGNLRADAHSCGRLPVSSASATRRSGRLACRLTIAASLEADEWAIAEWEKVA